MEGEKSALDLLLRRKQVLESLLSYQKRRASKRLSSKDVVDEAETSRAKKPARTPVKKPTSTPGKKSARTPVKKPARTPVKNAENEIENSYFKTPVKGRSIRRISASPDDSINTSTICLSRSHNFFGSPNITPTKTNSNYYNTFNTEFETASALSFNFTAPRPSTVTKYAQRHLPSTGPEVDNAAPADRSLSSAQAVVDDARPHFLSTGPEVDSAAPANRSLTSAYAVVEGVYRHVISTIPELDRTAPANNSPPSTLIVADDAHRHLPSTEPEVDSVASVDRSPTFAYAAVDDAHCHLPRTGSEVDSVTPVDRSSTSAYAVGEDDYRHLLSTGPELDSAAPADHLLPSAHAVVDDAHHHLPSTGSDIDSAAPVDRSPTFAYAAVDDAHCHLPSTGSEVDSVAPVDRSSTSAYAVGVDDYRYLPSTGSEVDSAAPADHLLPSAHAVVDDAHCHLPSTGSEVDSVGPVDRSSSFAYAVGVDDYRHLLSTGPEHDSAAPADNLLPSAHAVMDDAHRYLPSTGSEVDSVATVDCSTASACAVVDDAHRHIPSIEPEVDSAVPVDRSPSSAHTVVDDAHRHLPSTESEVDSAALVDHSPASAYSLVDDAHRHLPSTGTEHDSAAPADRSPSFDTNKLSKSQKRRKRRQATREFKKSCMDFLSDDEGQDFSAGSSDIWSYDSNSSSEDEEKKKRKKVQDKKIKRKKEKSSEHVQDAEITIQKRKPSFNVYKTNKNLKNEGKEYVTRKGQVMEAKSIKENPCIPGKCKRGCFEISEERRRSLFNFYWNLDIQRRRDWLVHLARVDAIRRKRVDSNRRKLTVDYFINDNEDRKKVCQKFLLNTLDITQRHLNYVVTNALEGMSSKELRTRTALDKYSESAKAYVRKFIESLPACPSHYNRKKSQRMYLPQDLRNLTNLYRIYRENCKENDEEIVSEFIFRKIFNEEYDLGFHSPKKDKCVLCTKAENTTNDMTEEDKEILKNHITEKEASYKRFKAHQTLKDVKTVCSSFDLQKVLNTPFGESMLLYYARKYAVFNFTVYESITQNVYCYTWGECDGKRGSNEMATCLYFYLKELDKQGVETALLYCDSCTGQNKNRVVLSVLNYFLLKSDNLQVIQINYLLPGHTYMPADSVHATIESEVKKIIVWSPTQWASYFETARKKPKPYKVNVMEHTDFINWEDLAAKTFTKETAKNVKFRNIRIATFKKKNLNKMEIKYSMNEDAVGEKVTLFGKAEKANKKGKGKAKGKNKKAEEVPIGQDSDYLQELNNINLQPSYTEKIAISALKYKDLKKLCLDGTIPKRFHKDFLELPYSGNKDDALIETDEEDEELIE